MLIQAFECLIQLQTELRTLAGDDLLPEKRPSAQIDEIAKAECKLGVRIPEDYREFLLWSDGCPNLTASFGLFGTSEFLAPDFGRRGSQGPAVANALLVGDDPETATAIFVLPDGSYCVRDPEFPFSSPTLLDLIEREIAGTRKSIQELAASAQD